MVAVDFILGGTSVGGSLAHPDAGLRPQQRRHTECTPRILHVGYDHTLIALRSHVLSSAGYAVEESDSSNKAIYLIESDSIDAVLICHTVPKSVQQLLVKAAKAKRRLLPLLFFACLR